VVSASDEAVRRWSAAIREVEILEPWLTESHWDEHYWDDVALLVVERAGVHPDRGAARLALCSALRHTFTVELRSDNGLFRDRLDDRIDLIVAAATGPV
jgi:hypothetical protein